MSSDEEETKNTEPQDDKWAPYGTDRRSLGSIKKNVDSSEEGEK